MPDRPLISIIIPVYNEEAGLTALHTALTAVLDPLPYRFELIMVDDGSRDGSRAALRRLAKHDGRVQPLELSRNFGKEIAVTSGIHQARGEAAIIMDADLQHPPDLIPEFIAKWQAGAEVVVGIRRRVRSGLHKRVGSHLFYGIMRVISRTQITPRATDYRLLDRVVIDAFCEFTERNRLTRGLIDWLGFDRDFVYFDAGRRQSGEAGYSFSKLTRLALTSVVSHSLIPLRVAGYIGAVITLVSGAMGIFIFIEKYIMGDPYGFNFSGPAILAVINLFLAGITLSCLGLIALYIAHIYEEVTNRPLYVLRRPRRRLEKT